MYLNSLLNRRLCCCFLAALGCVQGDLRGVHLGTGAGGAEGKSGDDAGVQTVDRSEWKHTHTLTEHGELHTTPGNMTFPAAPLM